MNNSFNCLKNLARVTIAFTLAIILLNCSFRNKDRIKDSNRFLLILNFPVVQLDGKLLNLTDSIFITFDRTTIIYQLPSHHSIEDDEKILFQELRYSGFVFNRDDKFGYFFNSINDSIGKKTSVDSILKIKAFGFLDIYDVIKESKLESSYTNPQNHTLTQVYSSKKIVDESYNDTSYLYFNKRNPLIDLPFSKKIDSVMNLSLFKARFLFNERYSELYKIKVPKRDITIDLIKMKNEISSEAKSFLHLFKSKIKKNELN
ncbi:MAG: hypothetical protein E6H07_10255 [Bacteroidetes bacterium]|nr:MAG: hypothetical protein E6H07_10255 [Bacteroidota bacterium]